MLHAQETFENQLKVYDRDDIHSIHKKLYLKDGRHELGVQIGGIVNNSGFALGTVSYQYHFFENAGIEAGLGGYGFKLGADDRLAFYQASLTFSPLYGKISLFTWAVANFDIYILGGGGVVNYTTVTKGSSFMANVGMGWRFFLNEWMSAKVEYRDYIYSRRNPANSVAKESVMHNHAITAGVSFMLPTRQRY
jgi:outer membrane beta-barrel protein